MFWNVFCIALSTRNKNKHEAVHSAMTSPRLKVPPASSPVIDRRTAVAADHDFLFEVFRSALLPEDALLALPESKREPLLRARFEAREKEYRKSYVLADFDVLTVDGKTAGNLYVDRGDDEFILINISLLPRYRNQGIGTAVVGRLVEEAGRLVLPVRARVPRRSRAAHLLQRVGFERVGDDGDHYEIAVPAIQPD